MPADHSPAPPARRGDLRLLVRNFIIELIIYGVLVVGYFLVVLRFLGDFVYTLFRNNLLAYSIVGLALIVAQGVLLDAFTSFLLNNIKLERLE